MEDDSQQRAVEDRLSAFFLDDATAVRSVRDLLFWLFVLTIGGVVVRVRTYLRLRTLMLRAMTRTHVADTGDEIELLMLSRNSAGNSSAHK